MHPDDFGEWKNNTANIYECLLKCTELVPICIRTLTSKVSTMISDAKIHVFADAHTFLCVDYFSAPNECDQYRYYFPNVH
jgi:hypothetical protein